LQEIAEFQEKAELEHVNIMEKHLLNELVPIYEKKSFILKNYSELRKKKEPVYTETFKSKNLEWRVKIYPNGSENSEDMHISIFV
jgi:hypothetical protein